MTEQEYDDLIAPKLAEIAGMVKDMGGSLVCRVEWEPGESGITQIGPMTSAGQWMTQHAAHAHGNIDAMLINLIKRHDVSQSMFLHTYNKPADQRL
jgi:hypothetical protein